MREGGIDPAVIREAKARADLVRMVEDHGVVLHKIGTRHEGCCPFHAEQTPSFSVYPDNTYHCYGCGAHGDAIAFAQFASGRSFREAVEQLAGQPLPTVARPASRRKHDIVMPAPEGVPFRAADSRKFGKVVAVWPYLDHQGRTMIVDVRYEREVEGEKKKNVITWCWARDEEGTASWTMTRPTEGLPLYGLDRLAARTDEAVIIGEGCKSVDAIQRWLPDCVAVGWCGGVTAVEKEGRVALGALAGRSVWLWPDADWVGANAAGWLLHHLTALGAKVLGVVDILGHGEGWDAADCDQTEATARWQRRHEDPAHAIRTLLAAHPRPAKNGKPEGRPCPLLTGGTVEPEATEPPPPTDGEQPPVDEPQDDSQDRGDIANASRFVADHARNVRYVAENKTWYLWDGRCWLADLAGRVLPLAETTMRGLAAEHLARAKRLRAAAQAAEEDRREGLLKAARTAEAKAEQVQSYKRIKDMISLAQARPEILIRPDELDPDEHLLCCLSGMIDLKNGRCYAHDRKYLATRCMPTTYDEKGLGQRDPILDRVVRHVCNGDDQVIQFAQLSLGRSLFGHCDLEKVYIWWGEGGSGKGTLFESIKSAMGGEYCMTAEFQTFIKTQGYRVRDDLERLRSAHLVIAAEAEQGEHLAASVIKAISGGDTITARRLYGTHSEFKPRLTLHLQCNDRPRVSDLDSGMWRRLVLIPCGPTVPESERDPAVKRHLQSPAGRAAILAWLVAGAVDSHGMRSIPFPPAVAAAVNAYRTESDTSKDFISECLLLSDQFNRERTWATCRDVIDSYHRWAEGMHLDKRYRASDSALCKRLEARGCWRASKKIDGVKMKVWLGLTLPRASERNLANGSTYLPSLDEHEAAMGASLGTGEPGTADLVKSHTCAHENSTPTTTESQNRHRDFTKLAVPGSPVPNSLHSVSKDKEKSLKKPIEEPSDPDGTWPAVF
jgi:P4 family phage/plasmid primase-like protien